MAVSAGEIEVILSAQTRKFVAAMKESQKETQKLAKAALTVGKALAAVAAAKKVVAIIDSIGRAAGTQARALNDLELALQRAGVDAPREATKEFAEFAAELQKVTTVGDETAIQVAAIGASFGITGDQLKTATSLAADISRVLGTDLKAAMVLLGKAAKGNISSLTRYGVTIDQDIPKAEQFNAVLGELEKLFGGAARSTDDYVSKTIQLGNAWGDLQETLGDADFLLDIIDNLKETVVWWDNYVKGVKAAESLSDEFSSATRDQQAELARLQKELADVNEEIAGFTTLQSDAELKADGLLRIVDKLRARQSELTTELRFTEEAFSQSIKVEKASEEQRTKLKDITKKLAEEEARRNAVAKEAIKLEKLRQEALKRAAVLAAPLRAQELADAKALEEQQAKDLTAAQKLAEQAVKNEERRQQAANDTAASIGQLGASFVTAAASAASGEKTFTEALKETISALASVAAAAVAKFVFAEVPPPASFALAPIAGAAAFAAINQLANFHQGGIVRQSELLRLPGMGADEGIAILRANERVLTPQQRASGAEAAGGAGDVNIVMQLVAPPTRADVDRSIRTAIVPALRRLRRKGAF